MPAIVSSRTVSAIVTAPYDHTVSNTDSYTRAEHSNGGTRIVSTAMTLS